MSHSHERGPHQHHVHFFSPRYVPAWYWPTAVVHTCPQRPYYHHHHRTHIHIPGYVPHIVGLFLLGASIAFLAAFILPIIAKVLLSLVLIAGAVTVGAAVYNSCTGPKP